MLFRVLPAEQCNRGFFAPLSVISTLVRMCIESYVCVSSHFSAIFGFHRPQTSRRKSLDASGEAGRQQKCPNLKT